MQAAAPIPVFALYGETAPFPDVIHIERIIDRAAMHGWTIPAHRHGQLAQMIVIERGAASARIDGETLDLRDGDFLFVPPHAVHGYRFDPATVGQVISLPSALVGPELAGVLGRRIVGRTDAALSGLIALLVEGCAGTGRFRTQRVLGLVQALLAALAETAPIERPLHGKGRDDRLARLDALIPAQMGQGWAVRDYAAALQISTGHLGRLCRAASGMGAKAYVEQAVMEEASRLLAFTRLPLAEIGYRLGFEDPSHFSKRFRAARGLAPSAYRRQLETRPPDPTMPDRAA